MDYLKDVYTYYIQYKYLQTHNTENFFHTNADDVNTTHKLTSK